MGVSIIGGSPKWLVYNGKSYSNGWFKGTPISGYFDIFWVVFDLLLPICSWLQPCTGHVFCSHTKLSSFLGCSFVHNLQWRYSVLFIRVSQAHVFWRQPRCHLNPLESFFPGWKHANGLWSLGRGDFHRHGEPHVNSVPVPGQVKGCGGYCPPNQYNAGPWVTQVVRTVDPLEKSTKVEGE